MQALAFRNTQFEIIDRDGNPWLRANQIGLALKYKNPELSIAKLYRSNADEFTENMTALIELDTTGGKQQVRIFSLRGAHLLGMFARTELAKEFRHWVLDVLEGVAEIPTKAKPKKPKAIAGAITEEQQSIIRALVKNHLETLPKEKQGAAARKCWGSLSKSFACKSYKDIPAEQFSEAVSLLSRRFLEGEFLGKEPEPKDEDSLTLSGNEVTSLYKLMSHYSNACDLIKHMSLSGVAKLLESKPLFNLCDQVSEAGFGFAQLDKRRNEIYDIYKRRVSSGGYAMNKEGLPRH